MSEWVLLLGGSTGHGAATAKKLAKDGYGIIAFHFDRGEAKKRVTKELKSQGLWYGDNVGGPDGRNYRTGGQSKKKS